MEAWTDERLDDLAATLRPLPERMARVEERLESIDARLESLTHEMRLMRTEIRQDFSALQRQFAQQGWAMAIALIGALVAVIISVA